MASGSLFPAKRLKMAPTSVSGSKMALGLVILAVFCPQTAAQAQIQNIPKRNISVEKHLVQNNQFNDFNVGLKVFKGVQNPVFCGHDRTGGGMSASYYANVGQKVDVFAPSLHE